MIKLNSGYNVGKVNSASSTLSFRIRSPRLLASPNSLIVEKLSNKGKHIDAKKIGNRIYISLWIRLKYPINAVSNTKWSSGQTKNIQCFGC